MCVAFKETESKDDHFNMSKPLSKCTTNGNKHTITTTTTTTIIITTTTNTVQLIGNVDLVPVILSE